MNNEKIKRNKFLTVIILSVIFGITGGVSGEIVARTYLLDSYYNIPFFGEINLPNGGETRSGLIIKNANKVVVEQDTKIVETINYAKNNIVGVFKRNTSQKKENEQAIFNYQDYYQINNEVGQGAIITSDGWVLTNYKPSSLEDCVIISKDEKIYDIDKVVYDEVTGFNFLHIKASDLSVKKFSQDNEIDNGQIVLSVNWDGASFISRIRDKNNIELINSSDYFSKKLVLVDDIPKEFISSPLFNLAGDFVGVVNNDGEIEIITNLKSAIDSLLKNKEINRASLGVNYISLSGLVNTNKNGAVIYRNNIGIAVVKKSSADLAGLKEMDIIISVDGTEINKDNNLTDIIQQYLAGDKVNIIYLRNEERREIEVEL